MQQKIKRYQKVKIIAGENSGYIGHVNGFEGDKLLIFINDIENRKEVIVERNNIDLI